MLVSLTFPSVTPLFLLFGLTCRYWPIGMLSWRWCSISTPEPRWMASLKLVRRNTAALSFPWLNIIPNPLPLHLAASHLYETLTIHPSVGFPT